MVRAFAIVTALTLSPALCAQETEPYDVLFIAVDDLNDWVGHLGGHPQARTPNIDRLAARGLAFLNAQAPSSLCNPTRTAILTGLAPSSSGVYGNLPDWREVELFADKPTLPRHFRDNGYQSIGAGKIFHAHTFYESGLYGFNDLAAWDAFYPRIDRQLPDELAPPEKPHNENFIYTGFDWYPLVAEDDALGDGQVVSWLEQQILANDDPAPRFVAAGIFRPHLPWYVPEAYFEQFPLEDIELPAHLVNDLDDVPPFGRRSDSYSVELHQWVLATGTWKEAVQAYLASVAYADEMIGRLLDALDQSGRADRTIIVLWGDHGFHLGEKGRWRKMTLWGDSTHVPFIIVAPGVTTPGTTTGAPVSLMSIYPTLAELTGLPLPDHVEGPSLTPLLRDPDAQWDRPVVSTYGYRNHAVVSEQYRYIRYVDGSEELYDFVADPHEWINLAGDERYSGTIEELARYLPEQDAIDLRDVSAN
jgi:arylsulfatase A-like enzyme